MPCFYCITLFQEWLYSDEEKKEALRYHNEMIPFNVIGRLLHIAPNSIIRWVKETAKQLKEIVHKPQENYQTCSSTKDGRIHDKIQLEKFGFLNNIPDNVPKWLDKAFQGIQKYTKNVFIPHKYRLTKKKKTR